MVVAIFQHVLWSFQEMCKARKADSTFIAINIIHYKFNATHLHRTSTKSNCKKCTLKCLYYLLTSTSLFFYFSAHFIFNTATLKIFFYRLINIGYKYRSSLIQSLVLIVFDMSEEKRNLYSLSIFQTKNGVDVWKTFSYLTANPGDTIDFMRKYY